MEEYYNTDVVIRSNKFSMLLQELVSTEKSYLQDMENVERLLSKMSKLNDISRDSMQFMRIVGHMCDLSRFLIEHVSPDVTNLSLYLKIFNQYKNNFQYVYLDYSLIYQTIVEMFVNSVNEEQHLMIKIIQSELHMELDFHSYLLKPIQRLSKYPTFFEEILKEKCISLQEFDNLELLKSRYVGIIFFINEFKNRVEGVMHWADVLENNSEIKAKCNELNIGDYIIHGDFNESGKQFSAYCFTNTLLIILGKSKKKLKLQSFIEVSNMRICENKDTDELQFVVEDNSSKKFKKLFKSKKSSQQKMWINTLKTVIMNKTSEQLNINKICMLYGIKEGRKIILLNEMILKSSIYMMNQAGLKNLTGNALRTHEARKNLKEDIKSDNQNKSSDNSSHSRNTENSSRKEVTYKNRKKTTDTSLSDGKYDKNRNTAIQKTDLSKPRTIKKPKSNIMDNLEIGSEITLLKRLELQSQEPELFTKSNNTLRQRKKGETKNNFKSNRTTKHTTLE